MIQQFNIKERLLSNKKVVGVLFLGLIWLGSWLGLYRLPFVRVHALEAIPYNTPLLLECNHVPTTLDTWRKQPYSLELQGIQFVYKWIHDLEQIDQFFTAQGSYPDVVQTARVVAGAQWSGEDAFEWLFVFEKYKNAFDIEKFTQQLPDFAVQKTNFRGGTVYELRKDGALVWTMASYKGLILMARKTSLVELGLEQLYDIRSNVFFSGDFNRCYRQLSRKSAINLYINYKDLPILLNTLSPTIPQYIEQMRQSLSWSGLELQTDSSHLLLTGRTRVDSNNDFWYSLTQQEAVDTSSFIRILPDNTALAVYFGLENFKSFYNDYNDTPNEDFEKYVLPLMRGELLYFITDPTATDLQSSRFVALRTDDIQTATQLLESYAQTFGELKTIDYQNFKLTQIASTNLLKPIFGGVLNPLENPYYLIVDDCIVFCNSAAALQLWVEKYNFNKTLVQMPAYQTLMKSMASDNVLYIFINTPYTLSMLKRATDAAMHPFIEEQFINFRLLSPIGIQFKSNSGEFVTNAMILYQNAQSLPRPTPPTDLAVRGDSVAATVVENPSLAHVAWRAELQADLQGEPMPIYHSETNTYYIAAQDVANRLYIFSQSGDLVWDKQLESPVLSVVYGLDFHKNNSIYFVFNTKKNIYFIDKSGNEFKKIPLIAPAATGLLLVDYPKGVRLFVGCTNGNIYGYDKHGKPLIGWNPKSGVGTLAYPMQFLEIGAQAYVFAQNKANKLYFSAIDGITHSQSVEMNGAVGVFQLDVQAERIATGLASGKIQVINLKGKTFVLKEETGVQTKMQFVYANIAGDGRKDYLRYSNGTLAAHYYNDQNKFVPVFKQTLNDAPQTIFEARSPQSIYSYIGGVTPAQQRIYLYDNQGILRKGFPLAGTTRFSLLDLLGDKSETLVVGNKNVVLAYKLVH